MIKTETLQIKYVLEMQDTIRKIGLLQEQWENVSKAQKEAANSEEIVKARKEVEELIEKEKLLTKELKEQGKSKDEITKETKPISKEKRAAQARQKELQEAYKDSDLSKIYDEKLNELSQSIQKEREIIGDYALTSRELTKLIKDNNVAKAGLAPNSDKAIQLTKENQRLNTIKNGGIDAQELGNNLRQAFTELGPAGLKLGELETLASHLFRTIKDGSKSSQIQEHELYQEFLHVQTAITSVTEANKKRIQAELEYQNSIRNTINTQNLEANSITHLREYYQMLEKEVYDLANVSDKAAKKKITELNQVGAVLSAKENSLKGTSGFMNSMLASTNIGSIFMGNGLAMAAGRVIDSIVTSWREGIDKIKEKSREITLIQNGFDTTRIQAAKMNKELESIDTSKSVHELNNLAKIGAEINTTKEELHGFIEVADQLDQVLGADFASTEEAVTMIATLKQEFKETKDLKMDESMRRIGSAIKELNVSGPADTKGITDFLKRAGQLNSALKPAIQDLMGFAAVFDEANMKSELSSSNFSKILTTAANNIEVYAKQMHMTTAAAKDLINTNSNEFILKLAKSMEGLKGTDFAKTMQGLKLEGSETNSVMGTIVDNIDKIREKQALANQAYSEGSRIQKDFNELNKDQAAQIDKTAKAWDNFKTKIVLALAVAFGPTLQSMAGMAKQADSVSVAFQKQGQKLQDTKKNIAPLVDEYKKLQEEAKKGVDNHQRLNQVIQSLGYFVPEAVSQWGKYGEAVSINIGLMDDFIKKQEEAFKKKKDTLKQTTNDEIYAAYQERNKLIAVMNNVAKKGDYLIYKDLMDSYKKQIADYNTSIIAGRKTLKDLETEIKVDDKKGGKDGKGEDGKGGQGATDLTKPPKTKDGQDERLRYLAEEDKKLVELRAKVALDERLQLASEHEKKKILLDKQEQDDIRDLYSTFKTQKGLVIEFSKLTKEQQELIQKEEVFRKKQTTEEKLKLDQEYVKKSDAIYEEQAQEAVRLAQQAQVQRLQINKKKAGKNDLANYNADFAILQNSEGQEKYSATVNYLKQKEEAKDNADALVLIERNYTDTIMAIEAKFLQEWDELWTEFYKNFQKKATDNNLKKLALEVSDAEAHHEFGFEQKLALLDAEYQAEIANAKEIGASTALIEEEFRQKREQLNQEHWMSDAEKIIGFYQQAFGAVTTLMAGDIQNRMLESENATNLALANLEKQKDGQVITSRQAAKEEKIIRDKADKEQRKLKKEQWELDKAGNISKIIIETALAVMKAGGPLTPLGIGTMIAGGAGLAVAIAQKAPQYWVGGEVESINQNLPSLVKPSSTSVLAWLNEKGKEYVVPNWQLQDPYTNSMVQEIEYRRKNGIKGAYADGGFTDNSPHSMPGVATNNMAGLSPLIQQLGIHINNLGKILEQPIKAQAIIGEREIYQLEQEKNLLVTKLASANANTNNTLLP